MEKESKNTTVILIIALITLVLGVLGYGIYTTERERKEAEELEAARIELFTLWGKAVGNSSVDEVRRVYPDIMPGPNTSDGYTTFERKDTISMNGSPYSVKFKFYKDRLKAVVLGLDETVVRSTWLNGEFEEMYRALSVKYGRPDSSKSNYDLSKLDRKFGWCYWEDGLRIIRLYFQAFENDNRRFDVTYELNDELLSAYFASMSL